MHQINRERRRALARLSYVGKSTALMAWGLGLVWIIGDLYLWFSQREVIIAAILLSLSESQPLLTQPGFALSRLATALLFLLDVLPIVVTSLVWVLTGTFFLRLSRNELWTARNFRLLWCAGILNILGPFLFQLSWTGQGLAVSLDLPRGERIFVFSLGISTGGVYEVVVGIILCAFAWMIRESTKIVEENALYI
ncbi:hypothetical protein RI820_001939 [Pluralibacter gergoviae]|nr:hypothetical protein [Pluralibacter gergoviae]ELC3016519.1 hypothetical protein [Pluralibacter gergoviae]ELC3022028.1 hypothetical protein [Pluralibacter gergoviae]